MTITFANPQALWWALLALPVAVLHLRKACAPRYSIGTAMIWRQALASERARAAWLPWRGAASLGVQVAILLSMAIGLAEPILQTPRLAPADLSPVFLATALGLLTVEWGLFQRRWMS